MLPVALDPNHTKLGLAGNGELALNRLRALRRAGFAGLSVYGDAKLASEAGECFRGALPDEAALGALHMLFITGLAPDAAAELAATARALRVLVNVEDVPALCDFHSVAEVRRGDLLLTISTNGAAPGLARSIRRSLEAWFPPEWEERVNEISALRQDWRAQGIPMAEAARRIDAMVDERCWLSTPQPN
jgi:precorrin-2 dehydrogenase/sirohydrochlorin ferrochelatase